MHCDPPSSLSPAPSPPVQHQPEAAGTLRTFPVSAAAPSHPTPTAAANLAAARLEALDLVRAVEAAGSRGERWQPVLERVAAWLGADWCALVDGQGAHVRLLATSGAAPPASAARQSSIDVAGGLRLELAGPPLDAQHRNLLEALALHLARSWRRAGEEERAADAPAVLGAALDCLAFGVLLVTPDGGVLFANAAARDLLGEGHGLALRDGRLRAADRALAARLEHGLRSPPERDAASNQGLAIRLPPADGQGPPLELMVVPAGDPWVPRHQRSSLVLLSLAGPGHVTPAGVLRELYGLTPAEARVAQALLTGQSVPEVAASLGRRPGTVRAHLKQLYAKLGTTRRSDLVRLLLVGPGRLRW